eukprot:TRINITY_DN114103_c0_g1_i1.p1 TRINITY_DN114103_c0_g1~~TRINITY_DN114103_c0_g1_i1.p1  ORF type:complete len:340 (+),score=60.01 TRINITY_DN114103_c0_g1_i1:28-1047(+)
MTDLTDEQLAAAKWLAEADAVLVCGGAGMSAKDDASGENVYVSPEHFATHYPYMPKRGYNTAYECMGLMADNRVPDHAKWGFWSQHFYNLRYKFEPCEGYTILKGLVGDRNHFVLTSNGDGCFERAGWDPAYIYTPQGDAAYYQCMRPCDRDAVYDSQALFAKLRPEFDEQSGLIDPSKVPRCQKCGGPTFMNLRGGDWFLHTKFAGQAQKFREWVEAVIAQKQRLVVIELGAGFNTPVVTRFPCEAIAREASALGAALIRMNPQDCMVPGDLPRAVGLAEGWQGLRDISRACNTVPAERLSTAEQHVINRRQRDRAVVPKTTQAMRFDWRRSMEMLMR